MSQAHLRQLVLGVIGSIWSLESTGQDGPSGLKKLFALKGVQQSVSVVAVNSGKALFSLQPDLNLSPASVSKVFATAAALDHWGGSHVFETKVFYRGRISDGVLEGDLVIEGAGDPFLVSERVWQLTSELRLMGLRKVTGKLLIDNSKFSGAQRDASRKAGLKATSVSYDSPLTAFAINFNTLTVAVSSGLNVSKPVIQLDPYPLSSVTMSNNTSGFGSSQRLKVLRKEVSPAKSELLITGQVRKKSTVRRIYRSVGNPERIAADMFKSFLSAAGIQVSGGIGMTSVKARDKLLHSMPSVPLVQITRGLNVYSNNFMTDMLIKNLATSSIP